MNIKKTAKLLKKINNLFDGMREDASISAIERDLFLSYLRDLYEAASTQIKVSKNDDSAVSTTDELLEAAPSSTPVQEVVVKQSDKEPVAVVDEHPLVEEQQTETSASEEPAASELSEEMRELFTMDSVKEVSDRLSMTPIADMNRCMGINERIFTIKELFGGDDQLFSTTMGSLNGFSNFEDAAAFLQHGVASANNWADPSMSRKAANFIKLVYRRYL